MSRDDPQWPDEKPFDDSTRIPTTATVRSAEARRRSDADPQYQAWRTALAGLARPAGLASAAAAVMCGILTVTLLGDGLSDGGAGQFRLSGWLAIGGAAVAGLLLAFYQPRGTAKSANLAVPCGIVTGLVVITLVQRARAASEHAMALSFLGQTSTLLLSVLGLAAAAFAWLCLTLVVAGPPRGRTDAGRAGAVTAVGAILVWALTIGLIAGIAPASQFDATTTDSPLSQPAVVDGFDVAYRVLPSEGTRISPIVGGFLLVDDDRVTAYDGTTGDERWHFGFGEAQLSIGTADTQVRRHGTEVVVTRHGYTVVLDATTGRIRHRSTRADGQVPEQTDEYRSTVVSRAFHYPSGGHCGAPIPLEVDGATVTADCARPGRLQRTDDATGQVQTVVVGIPARSVFARTTLQDLGDSLVAMTVWPDRALTYNYATTQTIVIDVATGTEVDRFTTEQYGGTYPAVSRRGDQVAVVDEKADSRRSSLVLRNVRTHAERRIGLADADAGPESGLAWIGDTVVAPLPNGKLARVDTAHGDAVTIEPAPCPSFGRESGTAMRTVSGAVLVRCWKPDEIVALR